MKKQLFSFFLLLAALPAAAQKSSHAQDVQAIKDMCGCYEVTFNFAETFAPDKDYEFHDNYRSGGIEYVLPVSESDDKIVLQHLLIIGDSMIIKHWRQDWLYEETDLYAFHKDNTWQYRQLPKKDVKGQWTQKVYQVDDSPRYEGSASWVHADGRHYWENTTDAPLPRREFSKRSDYNVMKRRNRQEITAEGWVHEQDNDKIIRENGTDELLAQEKGWNTYKKTDEEKCALAKQWWAEHSEYWADVRAAWDEVFAARQTVKLKKEVEGQKLFMRLFALEDEMMKDDYDSATARKEIRKTIGDYLEGDFKFAMAR